MVSRIIGLSRIDYEKDNKRVSGWRFYLTSPLSAGSQSQPNFGDQADNEYFSDYRLCDDANRDLLTQLSQPAKLIGQLINISYNKRGYVESAAIVAE